MIQEDQDVNNLEELLETTADTIHFTKEELQDFDRSVVRILGVDRIINNTIEEIAELINVVSKNIIDHFDRIHTMEEINDVVMMTSFIQLATEVEPAKSAPDTYDESGMVFMKYFYKLSMAQQYLSKYIRYKSYAEEKLAIALFLLRDVAEELSSVLNISKSEMSKIEVLKYKRIQDKIKSNELR